MAVQVIVSQNGPLPITATFQSPSDAPSDLMLAGSVRSTQINSTIGVQLTLDGSKVGVSTIWANPVDVHMTTPPAFFKVQLKQGMHKIVLGPATSESVGDLNDHFSVVLFY